MTSVTSTTLLLDERPRMFRANPVGFSVAVLLVPLFGLGLLILLWMWIRTLGERITVSDRYILVERGILNKDRTETAINGIRTVNIKQTFFNRIFGVGDIQIFTAGDEPEASIAGIYAPHRVRDLVRAHQDAARDRI